MPCVMALLYANLAALITLNEAERSRVRVTAPNPNVAPVTTTAMIAGGVAVALLPRLEEARIKSTKTDAQALRSAVMLYVADNPRECPTVEDLVSERYLDGSRRTADAWDTDFQITCEDGDIAVISAGPDLEFNTEDDI